MDECDISDPCKRGNDMTMKVLTGVVSLGTLLVLGAYGYTWSEGRDQNQEKYQWRQDHQRVLDKRFEELRQGQDKLADKLDKNTGDTKEMLQKILDEQKRVSDNMDISNKSRHK
jgi:hypothetical protein